MNDKTAILVLYLGTPKSTQPRDIKRYLREFLSDPRVISLPAPLRSLLVSALIVPLRWRKTRHAYTQIWTPQGSPLLQHCVNLQKALQTAIGEDADVYLGMRYGEPSLSTALDIIKSYNYPRLLILPLYPQYSSAATGSALEQSLKYLSSYVYIPQTHVIPSFYLTAGYIKSYAQLLCASLGPRGQKSEKGLQKNNHILFTYHGLPMRDLKQPALRNHPLCQGTEPCPVKHPPECYRAQCYSTTRAIAEAAGLSHEQYSTAFQSRLGYLEWIKPYASSALKALYAQGIRDLTVICPSFVVDCLETLEEIDIRLQEEWLQLGGEKFERIPCLNNHPVWVEGLKQMILDSPIMRHP